MLSVGHVSKLPDRKAGEPQSSPSALQRVVGAPLTAHLDARQKIAMLVLDLYGRLRRGKSVSGNTYVLPLTQQQIGDSLGLTSIHVNRTLGELRRHGIVRLERSVVTILDPNMLTRLADGRQA
jgi:CRP-like cAMP-binding protein